MRNFGILAFLLLLFSSCSPEPNIGESQIEQGNSKSEVSSEKNKTEVEPIEPLEFSTPPMSFNARQIVDKGGEFLLTSGYGREFAQYCISKEVAYVADYLERLIEATDKEKFPKLSDDLKPYIGSITTGCVTGPSIQNVQDETIAMEFVGSHQSPIFESDSKHYTVKGSNGVFAYTFDSITVSAFTNETFDLFDAGASQAERNCKKTVSFEFSAGGFLGDNVESLSLKTPSGVYASNSSSSFTSASVNGAKCIGGRYSYDYKLDNGTNHSGEFTIPDRVETCTVYVDTGQIGCE